MASDLPNPARFLRLGWRATRRVPGIWVARALFEGFGTVFQLAFLFAVGLLFVIHFATHIESGLPLGLWPTALFETLRTPSTLIGLGGVLFVGWLFLFTVESLVYAGMWSATHRSLTGEAPAPWRSFFSGAVSTFPRALAIRLFVRASEFALFAVIAGSLAMVAATASGVATTTGSTLLAPAATWALLLTVGSLAAVVFRLSAELVAAAVYVDDVGLGEGLLRAAGTVLARPMYVYRLFVISAVVLIPPLVLAWMAALGQNVLMATGGAEGVAMMLRLGAEAAIMLGLAVFSVVLHATFFAYYAWDGGELDETTLDPRLPALSQLLPSRYAHIVTVDEILSGWSKSQTLAPSPSAPVLPIPPPPRARQPERRFDLGAILRSDEEE